MSECEASDEDKKIDYTSEFFDPLKFLYAPNIKLTDKKIKRFFQNTAAFESALKKNGIWNLHNKDQKSVQASDDKQTSSAASQPRFSQTAMMTTYKKQKCKSFRNVQNNMEKSIGCLALLWDCVKDKILVKVNIRSKRGLRGTLIGIILYFDKHWNLVLENVNETWKRRKYKYDDNKFVGAPENCSRRLLHLGITLPACEVKSIDRKNVQISRKIEKLLIRGEQIAFIQVLRSEG